MMILHLGKPKLTYSFIEQNVSIKQVAAIYWIKVLSCSVIKFSLVTAHQMRCLLSTVSGSIQCIVWSVSCVGIGSKFLLNIYRMTFRWRADSGSTPCADLIQTGISLCGCTV